MTAELKIIIYADKNAVKNALLLLINKFDSDFSAFSFFLSAPVLFYRFCVSLLFLLFVHKETENQLRWNCLRFIVIINKYSKQRVSKADANARYSNNHFRSHKYNQSNTRTNKKKKKMKKKVAHKVVATIKNVYYRII